MFQVNGRNSLINKREYKEKEFITLCSRKETFISYIDITRNQSMPFTVVITKELKPECYHRFIIAPERRIAHQIVFQRFSKYIGLMMVHRGFTGIYTAPGTTSGQTI